MLQRYDESMTHVTCMVTSVTVTYYIEKLKERSIVTNIIIT